MKDFGCFIHPALFIASTSEKGRGIFTSHALPGQTLVEVAPVVVLGEADRKLLHQTALQHYYFCWPEDRGALCCMALGYVSIYNHSYEANCIFSKQEDTQTMSITTLRAIDAGEELTLNYNGIWNDPSPLWFPVM